MGTAACASADVCFSMLVVPVRHPVCLWPLIHISLLISRVSYAVMCLSLVPRSHTHTPLTHAHRALHFLNARGAHVVVEVGLPPPLAPHHLVCVEKFTLPYLTSTQQSGKNLKMFF